MLNKIRLKKIKLMNFKNIISSEIIFESEETKSVTGIYGANGSGKTAIIDSIDIVKQLISGSSFKMPFFYVNTLASKTLLTYYFEYTLKNDEIVNVEYSIEFKRQEQNVVFSKEKLTLSKEKEKILVLKIDRTAPSVKNAISLNQHKFSSELFEFEKTVKEFSISNDNSVSLIFGKLYTCLKDNKQSNLLEDVVYHFNFYSNMQMIIVKNSDSSKISANNIILFQINIQDENSYTRGVQTCNLLGETPIELNHINILNTSIEQCNKILSVIIPDFEIETVVSNSETINSNGKICKNITFVSKRNDITIPLMYESDGIKKLISIVSALISCYNNKSTLVAIDELDAGVYEYLLGQIVEVISTSGKGQLIFTSHNLRILEVINVNSIVFTTLNPKNRFVKFKNCKPTNNLRSVYIRTLQLGGQKEELYKTMDNVDLKLALKQASKITKG